MNAPRVVVDDPRRVRRRRLLVALGAALVLLLLWGVYQLGVATATEDYKQLSVRQQRTGGEHGNLRARLRALKSENRRLSAQNAQLMRAVGINEATIDDLRQALKEKQARIAKLQKELAFYRGIVSPRGAEVGIQIEQFKLAPAKESGVYNYELVLIRAGHYDDEISGRVTLRLDGLRHGETQSLSMQQLSLDSNASLVFSFTYFQKFTGAMQIPAQFDPTQVVLKVSPQSQEGEVVQRYEWNDLVQTQSGSDAAHKE